MTKFSKFMSLTLVMALTFAMTACGGAKTEAPAEQPAAEETQAAETEQKETEAAEETTEEAAAETAETEAAFDIAANLTDTVSEDGATRTIETDHFTLTLSLPETWEHEVNDANSISFYNTAAKNNNCGGHLATIAVVDPASEDYKNLPHFAEVGEKDGMLFIVEFPSDVQADVQNEQNKADYDTVYAELLKIEEKAADMPLTLK